MLLVAVRNGSGSVTEPVMQSHGSAASVGHSILDRKKSSNMKRKYEDTRMSVMLSWVLLLVCKAEVTLAEL